MKIRLYTILVTGILATLVLGFSTTGTGPENPVELGEKLFFEKALSKDYSLSCASCHIPEFAFADTLAFSLGVGGKAGKRNTPAITNIAGRELLFYDGRASSLEDQVHFPIEDSLEMNVAFEEVIKRLHENRQYVDWFQKIYGEKPSRENVSGAIAAFERSLETGNTPFDDFMFDRSPGMSESAIRGRDVFMGDKAKCFDCHFGPDLTGNEFRNIGLYNGREFKDMGRFEFTKDSADIGKFKVPGLRNIAVTAPYMHNGMFRTLREVIEYYDNPFNFVERPVNLDSLMMDPVHFTEQEKTDLENFMLALTDRRFKIMGDE